MDADFVCQRPNQNHCLIHSPFITELTDLIIINTASAVLVEAEFLFMLPHQKFNDVAILYNVFLPFRSQFAGFASLGD